MKISIEVKVRRYLFSEFIDLFHVHKGNVYRKQWPLFSKLIPFKIAENLDIFVALCWRQSYFVL